MFYGMDKTEKRIALSLFFIFFYITSTWILNLPVHGLKNIGMVAFLLTIPKHWYIKLFLSAAVTLLMSWLPNYDLKNIKAKEAGDGQYGKARWATEKEIGQYYSIVKMGKEKEVGFIVGRTDKGEWIVDTSDMSELLVGPPGCAKTTSNIIPTAMYNAIVNKNTNGQGASMLFTDVKGDDLRWSGTFLEKHGYNNVYLNLREPFNSYNFNLLNNVNKNMNAYRNATNERDKLIAYGKAERYAKILAQSIVYNIDTQNTSDASAYFNETAQGLLTGIILLVSEYAINDEQKHILSVFNLIIDLNGAVDSDTPNPNQRNKLHKLLEHIDNPRIKQYVGAAMSADFRTSMNIFSSALGKLVGLIDAELEQMISKHSPEIDDIKFIDEPTAIFIICPDENPTRHFFATLFLRYFLNDLIEQARKNNEGKLKRQVLCIWEEFGNMPPIKNVDMLVSAARSAGIRLQLTLQSTGQLNKNYNQNTAKIIRESCQITVTTYVAPQAYDSAKEISQILGNQTVQSGSVSMGKGGSQTVQLMAKPLLSPDEIIKIPQRHFIVMKAGCAYPMRTYLPFFGDYLPMMEDYKMHQLNDVTPINYMTTDDIKSIANTQFELTKGMFD